MLLSAIHARSVVCLSAFKGPLHKSVLIVGCGVYLVQGSRHKIGAGDCLFIVLPGRSWGLSELCRAAAGWWSRYALILLQTARTMPVAVAAVSRQITVISIMRGNDGIVIQSRDGHCPCCIVCTHPICVCMQNTLWTLPATLGALSIDYCRFSPFSLCLA